MCVCSWVWIDGCTVLVPGIDTISTEFGSALYRAEICFVRGGGRGYRQQRRKQKALTKLPVLAQQWVSQCCRLESEFLADILRDGILMNQDVIGLVFHKRFGNVPYTMVVALLGTP